MKNRFLTCCILPLFLATFAEAGINGTYKVRGAEFSDEEKLTFTGTVQVSQYKIGKYSLKFSEDDNSPFSFKFSKALRDIKTPQTVSCYSSGGTGTATFSYVSGHYRVEFTYKAKGENIRGSGKGVK